jgi:hypothetical protein
MLLVVIGLHVTAALAHAFVFKDRVMPKDAALVTVHFVFWDWHRLGNLVLP